MFLPRIALAILFALAGVGGIYSATSREVEAPATSSTLTLRHQYRAGVHIFVGNMAVPTECHMAHGEAVVEEFYPEEVTIVITTPSIAPECPPKETIREFKVAFGASPEAHIRTLLDGVEIFPVIEEVGVEEMLSL